MKKISFLTHFKDYGMTTQEFLNFCKKFILRLKEFDSRFQAVHSWSSNKLVKGCYLKNNLSDFDEIVFSHLYRDVAYLNENPEFKELTLQSRNRMQFGASFTNTHINERAVTVSISCGKNNATDLGILNIDHSPDLQEQLTLQELLARLEFVIDTVPLVYAMIGHTPFMSRVNEDLRKHPDEIKIGWITYTNRIETAEVLPDYVSYKKLPTGVIFWLSDTKITADDTEYVEKGIEVRNILAKNDLLKYN